MVEDEVDTEVDMVEDEVVGEVQVAMIADALPDHLIPMMSATSVVREDTMHTTAVVAAAEVAG